MLAHVGVLLPPEGLSDFWKRKKHLSDQIPIELKWHHEETIGSSVVVRHFSITGFTGNRVYGYVMMPLSRDQIPCVIHHHGYMYHGGDIREHMPFVEDGYAVITFDFRGQSGKSIDNMTYEHGDHRLMTRGIDHPDHYYMVYAYMDAYRILQMAKTLDEIDRTRLIIHGVSQGGGVALAVSALDDSVFLTLADVPSYSYLPGRLETRNGSIAEIASYVDEGKIGKEVALHTLNHIDIVHLSPWITSPVIVSTGLKDHVCPDAYFMPSYERIHTEKLIYRYPEAGHEGGGDVHLQIKRAWIKEHL